MRPFSNRLAAGSRLAMLLAQLGEPLDLVLALPRGGVPVGFAIAMALGIPLDVVTVRKLGVPGQPELAMGAIASGGATVLNEDVIRRMHISREMVTTAAAVEAAALEQLERHFRGEHMPLRVEGRAVVLVDDGLATGATMRAAVKALRDTPPKSLVVAVPVAARETVDEFRAEGINVVAAITPFPFWSVGNWYEDFTQTKDEEVCTLLRRASRPNE